MRRIRYAVPNLFTGASFLLGLASIISSQLGQLEWAGWFIVWCVLLDVADGLAARLLKATSKFGAQFDSLADLVAFGLAPPTLVLHLVWLHYPGAAIAWIAAACAFYALLAALRLARFNSIEPKWPGWFQGVPTTACGGLLATATIVLLRHEDWFALNWPLYLSVLMTVLAAGMISNLRFPKLAPMSNRLLNIPHAANILGVYVCGTLRLWPEYLFSAALVMITAGLVAGLFARS